MNILIVYAKSTGEIVNRQSALGSYIFCLANLLQKNNFNVWVNNYTFDELQKLIIPSPQISLPTNKLKKIIPKFVKEFKRDKSQFNSHSQIYNSINISEHIHAVLEFYTYGSTLGIQLKHKFNSRLITVFDSPVLEEYEFFNGKKKFNRNKIELNQLNSLKGSDKIVVYSNPVKKYVETLTGITNNCFIHQNVDFTRFEFIEPRKINDVINIGFVGSFLKWHRVDLLIEVFNKLASENSFIQLYLIGAGMEFENIKFQVNNSPFINRIHLTGFCDGDVLLTYKNLLHIGIMPGSNWYGAPNKIFEYGAAGLAVLAPNTPTIMDLFDDKTDLLFFEWNNLESATIKLRELIGNYPLLQELQVNLQKKIKNIYSEIETTKFYSKLIID